MNFIIKKCNYEEALSANKLLTKLILDEKQYDENINEKCTVRSLYENFYDNEDICLYVAKYENEIIGYIYGYIQNNGDTVKNTVCTLDALYVLEECRNKGVATELVNSFIKWCENNNAYYVELKVCNLNKEAMQLYEKFDFLSKKTIMTKSIKR